MSVKEKLLLLAVLAAVALGFLEHRFWSCAVELLQRCVAVGGYGIGAVVAVGL
jgi:hypothetical protein